MSSSLGPGSRCLGLSSMASPTKSSGGGSSTKDKETVSNFAPHRNYQIIMIVNTLLATALYWRKAPAYLTLLLKILRGHTVTPVDSTAWVFPADGMMVQRRVGICIVVMSVSSFCFNNL
jgi:hypothetical protein